MDLGDKSKLLEFLVKKHPAYKQLPSAASNAPQYVTPKFTGVEHVPPRRNTFDKEIRADVVAQLGQLTDEGEELRRCLMLDHLAYGAQYKFDEWEKKCEELLKASFNDNTLRFFKAPAQGIHSPLKSHFGTGVSYPNYLLYEKIASRVQRLTTIRARVESRELTTC